MSGSEDPGEDSPSPDYHGEEAALLNEADVRTWLVHEDDDFIVLNKPGGVVCHPSKNGPWSSLVGACREVFDLPRIHLAHRLDRETSGIVLLAKHRASARRVQMAFSRQDTEKRYIAIMDGHLKETVLVDQPLAKDMESEVYIKQTVRSSRSAQKAQTTFVPICRGSNETLALVIPQTGRKHQIRAHASWLGHPLRGDKIYGPDDQWYLSFITTGWTEEMAAALHLPRQALHALALRVTEANGEKLSFSTPPPADFWPEMARCGCPGTEEEFNRTIEEALAASWDQASTGR